MVHVMGAGAVASVGDGVASLFSALCAGESGLAELRGFVAERFRARHAFEIDDRPAAGHDVPGRATRWLETAIAEALADAGMSEDLRGVPVLVGTGLRELRSVELWWRDGARFDAADLHFGTALRKRFGAEQTHTFAGACSASLYTLGLAMDMLDAGVADSVVVAGVDTLTESMFGLLDRVQLVPPADVRPFDRGRRGVLMGDGAAAVVLRRDPADGSARARLRGVGLTCDAYHVTAPDPKGIARAILDAHDRAGVTPHDIDLVMLHGTGTLLNDEAEAAAVSAVFTESGAQPLVTAIKSMTGHTSGGSGLLSLVVGMAAMDSGRVPPTTGLRDPIEEAETLRFVRDGEARADIGCVQVNAFGFGGVNAVAIVDQGRAR